MSVGVSIMARLRGGLRHGVMSALAALMAYVPAHHFGLQQSFWGAITAIAVIQTEFHATEASARNQFAGAIIGGLVGMGLLLACGDSLPVYVAAVLLAILACWLLGISSASQLAGVTATILLLVPRTGPADRMLAARLSEVGWGVVVGISIVWLASRLWPQPPPSQRGTLPPPPRRGEH